MARPKERTTICESGIVCFSFNIDSTRCAFSPNSHLVHVVDCGADVKDCTTWKIISTLEGHDQQITGVDWSKTTNSILTCSQDRTAFVWTEDTATKLWKPCMVMLDETMKRGITVGGWSVSGKKIYFGSAGANVVVGHFDEENKWWHCVNVDASKVNKDLPSDIHRSLVTTIAPHPTCDFALASGSADGSVKIVSTRVTQLDSKAAPRLGTILFDYATGAWVRGAAWSPSGLTLAVASHNSQVHVATFSSTTFEAPVLKVINLGCLPITNIMFLSDTQLVGGGFDFYPMCFSPTSGGEWKLSGKWTGETEVKKVKTEAELAREKFQNQSTAGQKMAIESVSTKHKNVITSIVAASSPFSFATASMDGRVELWTKAELVSIS